MTTNFNFKLISLIKPLFFIALLFSFTSTFAQRHNIIFESTFESKSSITSWYEQNLLDTWSAVITKDQVRAGASSAEISLVRGVDLTNGPRAELGMAPQTANESWYGFSNFFPADYATDPATEVINQWQATPDTKLGETWRSPPLGLEIKDDRFKIAIRSSASPVNTDQNTSIDYLDLGPVDHNKWNDWVFHVKWSYNSGTLQIWKNGVLLLERLNKPIGYNDVKFPYFKIGIYKFEWSNPNTISTSTKRLYYIDEVRIGNNLATYNDVAPGTVAATLPLQANNLKIVKNKDASYTVSFTASKTVSQASKFILYISTTNGKAFTPIYSDNNLSLQQGISYSLTFKTK